MSELDDIAGEYIRRFSLLHPDEAVSYGFAGDPAAATDYSPAGAAARAELDRATLGVVSSAPTPSRRDRLAAEAMQERLAIQLELYRGGEWMRDLSALGSPVEDIRQVFDLLPRESDQDWEVVASRLGTVASSLNGLRASLEQGIQQRRVAARRQAEVCLRKARLWAGDGETPGFFRGYVSRYSGGDAQLRQRLAAGASAAEHAYADFARFLETTYLPAAGEEDGVGAERYGLFCRLYNGIEVDALDLYAWGWEELNRISEEMAKTADRIVPGASLAEVTELLETDPERAIEGEAAFLEWNQCLIDDTIEQLQGVHFDIPEPVRRVEAMIAPAGSGAAQYYTRPSEDFSRPGRTWRPIVGEARFPLWAEVSTVYHEGVPGHHLQLAQVCWLKDRINAYQRSLSGTSGLIEGWALYAERLMAELGYLENPDYYLGMLSNQALRACRVIVDVGLHLHLALPQNQSFHPGETWSAPLAVEFLVERARKEPQFASSEVDRYLGIPGQAIAYKLGERVWLEVRQRAQETWGTAFSLKHFHAAALDLGLVGLEQLRRELASAPVPD